MARVLIVCRSFDVVDAAITEYFEAARREGKLPGFYRELTTPASALYSLAPAFEKLTLRKTGDSAVKLTISDVQESDLDTLTPEDLAQRDQDPKYRTPPLVCKDEADRQRIIMLYADAIRQRQGALQLHRELLQGLEDQFNRDGWLQPDPEPARTEAGEEGVGDEGAKQGYYRTPRGETQWYDEWVCKYFRGEISRKELNQRFRGWYPTVYADVGPKPDLRPLRDAISYRKKTKRCSKATG